MKNVSAKYAELGPQKSNGLSDRFDAAAKLLSGAIIFAVLCLAAALVVSFSRVETAETARLAKELNLTDLSIIPSGRRPRAPESAAPSVDLDFSPFLPLDSSDPKFLVIEPPKSSGKISGNSH